MKKRLLLPFSLLCLAGMIVACTEAGSSSNQQSNPSSEPDSSIKSEESQPSVSPSSPSSRPSSSSPSNPPAPSSSEAPVNYQINITNAENLGEEWFASDGTRTLVLSCSPGIVRQLLGKEIFVASSDESIVKVENNQVLVPVAPGKVTITVIYHNAFATCKVTVKGMTRPATIEEIAKGVAAKTITSSDKAVELFGTVTGIYGNTAVIQEGDYAMYVYNKNYEGIAVGDRAHLISTYTLYNGLVETSAVSIFEKSTKPADEIKAKDYDATTFAELKGEDASRLINVSGIYSLGESLSKGGCAAQASSGAYRLSSVKIGELDSYIFVNKYLPQDAMDAINAKLNEAEAESKKIEVKGGHVYVNTSYMENLGISITSADQLVLSDSDIVTLPTKVELSGSADKMPVEETVKLTPKFTPANTNRKGLSYVSSNEAVATVSADGVVKGISAGSATITATSTAEGCENVKATFKVTVTAAEYVTAPVDNETYVMGLSQGNLSKRLYLNGEMDGYYFKTVEDKASAAEVKVEKQAGAENKYALKAGEKYLKIEVGGAYINTVLSDTPFYFTFDPVKCAFYETVTTCTNNKKNGDCYLGTSSSYVTVSAANNQVFFAHLYPLGEPAPAYELVGKGTEGAPYNVADAIFLGETLGTEVLPCYIKGIVKDAGTDKGSYVQNIKLVDSLGSEKELLVYTTNEGATDDLKDPQVGDTITINGFLMLYKGTLEISSTTVDGKKVYPVITAIKRAGNGSEANPFSVDEACAAIDNLGEAPNLRAFVTGVVKTPGTDKGNYYQNMYLLDENSGNELLVYSVNKGATDDLKEVKEGDIVTIDGFLMLYKGTKEISNATVDGQKIYPVITKIVLGGGDGSEAHPFSVDEACAAIDNLGEAPNVRAFVKGVVKTPGTDKGSYYQNMYLKDEKTGNELLVYSVNKGATDDLKEVKEGDIVTIDGFLMLYKGTKEISNATVDGQKIYPVITAKVAGQSDDPIKPDQPDQPETPKTYNSVGSLSYNKDTTVVIDNQLNAAEDKHIKYTSTAGVVIEVRKNTSSSDVNVWKSDYASCRWYVGHKVTISSNSFFDRIVLTCDSGYETFKAEDEGTTIKALKEAGIKVSYDADAKKLILDLPEAVKSYDLVSDKQLRPSNVEVFLSEGAEPVEPAKPKQYAGIGALSYNKDTTVVIDNQLNAAEDKHIKYTSTEGVVIEVRKNTSTSDVNVWKSDYASCRWYVGHKVTISSEKDFNRIVLTCDSGYETFKPEDEGTSIKALKEAGITVTYDADAKKIILDLPAAVKSYDLVSDKQLRPSKVELFAEVDGYSISLNSTNSEIFVYESGQDYTVAPVKTNSTFSRNEEGAITKWIEPDTSTTLQPQVNFKVVFEEGYEVNADCIAITGEYNKIKIAENNEDEHYAIIRVTKIKSDLAITVTPKAVQAGAVNGFEVNFVLQHCTVKVYVGPKDANGSNLDTADKYYTRSKDDPWGYSKDAAQFNFEIIPDAGYVFNDGLEWGTATELSSSAVNFISPTSSFNKIKKSANGGYTLTKVAGTLTITVSCTAA